MIIWIEVLVGKYDQLVGHFQTEVGDMYHSNWMLKCLYRGIHIRIERKNECIKWLRMNKPSYEQKSHWVTAYV